MDKVDLETLKAMRDVLIELAPFQSRRSDKDELYRRANIIANVIQFVEDATAMLEDVDELRFGPYRGVQMGMDGKWFIQAIGSTDVFPTAIEAWKSLKGESK